MWLILQNVVAFVVFVRVYDIFPIPYNVRTAGAPPIFTTDRRHWYVGYITRTSFRKGPYGFTLRYDTIGEFNVDWKAEYSALSSTRSQKKKLKQQRQCPFNTVQVKIREVSPEGIRVTMEERICERDEF